MAGVVPLNQVPKLVPGSPCVGTIRRWAATGVGGKKLPTTRIGGRVFVTEADLAQFIGLPICVDAQRAEVVR